MDYAGQFEIRKIFSVPPMLVTSQVDVTRSHWPQTLEEYFTTFHQNIEAVNQMLMGDEGLNAAVLSGQPKNLHNALNEHFNQEISYVQKNNKSVEIGYNIPLRQHAGKITFTYDPSHPEKGMSLTVNLMGINEGYRWNQVTLVGAYLGSCPDIKMEEGMPPRFNWESTGTGEDNRVEFTLRLQDNRSQERLEKLAAILSYVFQDLTMDYYTSNDFMVFKKLKLFESIENISPEIFGLTLHGLPYLMDSLTKDPFAKRVALEKIFSFIVSQKASTRNLISENRAVLQSASDLESFLTVQTQELRKQAPQEYLTLLEYVHKLPRANQKSDILNELEIKYQEEGSHAKLIQKLKWEGHILGAFRLAHRFPEEPYLQELLKDRQAVATALRNLQSGDSNPNPELEALLDQALQQQGNVKSKDAKSHIQALSELLKDPAGKGIEVIDLASKVLESTFKNPVPQPWDLSAITHYLGDFLPAHIEELSLTHAMDENRGPIGKGIVQEVAFPQIGSYIILNKEMRSTDPQVRKEAFSQLEHLAEFYMENENSVSPETGLILYALFKDYYLTATNKQQAANDIIKCWKNNPTHLSFLASQYTKNGIILPLNVPTLLPGSA